MQHAELQPRSTDSCEVTAFAQNQRDEVRIVEVVGALAAEPGMKQQTYLAYDVACFSAGQSSEAGSIAYQVEQSPTLRSGASGTNMTPTLHSGMQVRRLTPVECERLQGFPDGYTAISWRNKQAEDCPDGPRYKALGNSMAVPVMRWIGERIGLCANLGI